MSSLLCGWCHALMNLNGFSYIGEPSWALCAQCCGHWAPQSEAAGTFPCIDGMRHCSLFVTSHLGVIASASHQAGLLSAPLASPKTKLRDPFRVAVPGSSMPCELQRPALAPLTPGCWPGCQVMDRLCASPHLSQAVSVSSDKPWNESLLRMSFVVHQTHHAQAGAPSSFGLQHASLGSTRAGGVDSGDFGRADLLRTGRSRAQERRQRRVRAPPMLQGVLHVACVGSGIWR